MGLDQYHREHPRGDRSHSGAPEAGCADCQEVAANPLHIHGRAGECPVPGCQEAPAAELPTVLYRIEIVWGDDSIPNPIRRIFYQENKDAAIAEIEDALNNGAGLRSVHKLDLRPAHDSGVPPGRYKWTRLDYSPPGPGRLTVKPS